MRRSTISAWPACAATNNGVSPRSFGVSRFSLPFLQQERILGKPLACTAAGCLHPRPKSRRGDTCNVAMVIKCHPLKTEFHGQEESDFLGEMRVVYQARMSVCDGLQLAVAERGNSARCSRSNLSDCPGDLGDRGEAVFESPFAGTWKSPTCSSRLLERNRLEFSSGLKKKKKRNRKVRALLRKSQEELPLPHKAGEVR